MIERIIIAGAGGQGILLLGKILALAATRENKHVTWLPSYSAEVRGGVSYCMTVISDEEIDSPYIESTDTLLVMNESSLNKFKPWAKKDSLLVINRSLVRKDLHNNSHMLLYPFSDIAIKLGNIKVANMAALGCYLAKKKVVDIKNILNSIEDIAPVNKKVFVEINKKAVYAGFNLIK